MEGREATTSAPSRERTGAPGAAELLRAALEKIVFFEWRLSELTAELAAAQSRCAAAEGERERAHAEARKASLEAQEARRHAASLEAERARLATLLARPSHAPVLDEAALFAERDRAAQLAAELADARREVARQKEERARWLQEMIEQARQGDEAPAALAQFISELRGEVLALRDRQRLCDALLIEAGVALPAAAVPEPSPSLPAQEHDAVSQARKLWAEGRLGEVHPGPGARGLEPAGDDLHPNHWHANEIATGADGERAEGAALRHDAAAPTGTDLLPGLAMLQRAPAAAPSAPALAAARAVPAAQRALVEQCLRGLTASDASRRAQAARHLAALPLPAAAPGLAAALGRESEPRARAAIARALAACGGDGAAALIAQLQDAGEAALVRLSALDALSGMAPAHARAALERASFDGAPAIRRRAAALSLAFGGHADLLARLSVDPDASVRSAAGGEGSVPEAPLAEEELASAPASEPSPGAPTRIELPREDASAQSRAQPARARREAPSPAPASESSAAGALAQEALLAVRSAMLGLTEGELASALGLEPSRAESLVHKLIAEGVLARRGRRLIAGGSARAQGS